MSKLSINNVRHLISVPDNAIFYLCERRSKPTDGISKFTINGTTGNCIKVYKGLKRIDLVTSTPDDYAYICIINDKLALVCSFYNIDSPDAKSRWFIINRSNLKGNFDYLPKLNTIKRTTDWVETQINIIFNHAFKYICHASIKN